ncbi:MAG TPA: hypothetical protein VGK15_00080 [Candidatus Limnocylindria bacterium]|jgi:hypothetical protein
MNAARVRLSTLLRLGAPEIIRMLAEEAAGAANAEGSRLHTSADEYEAFLARLVPRALDAVGANDRERPAMLVSLARGETGVPIRPVPPVARVGLLSIGLRVSREHVERTVAGQPEAAAILKEFDDFARDLRAALAPLAARS